MLNFYPNDPTQRYGIYYEFGSFFETFDDPIRRIASEACAGFDGSHDTPMDWSGDSIAPATDDLAFSPSFIDEADQSPDIDEEEAGIEAEEEAEEPGMLIGEDEQLDTGEERVFKRAS